MSAEAVGSEMRFDKITTELDALQRAVYAVADLMTVSIGSSGSEFVCRLFARRQDADVAELEHRLRCELIDQTLRLRIARETEPVRNLIFALAFSQTGLADADEPQP
jgi:His-Xaa-Ser system protein HxsD